MNHNPTIAKLLAKENVTVQHGNYHTAWFDVKDRVLGLPIWKDMGKDVYDLLVGHEIGHALYTPYEGWHDSPEKLEGCPRSYINVIEDARIERFVRSDYPGLIRPMANGYKILLEDGFFSDVDNIKWDEVKLIDKINLKAKLQDLIEVPFTSEEKTYFDRAFTTETFDEVVELCREILAFTKENQPELLTPPPVSEDEQAPGNNDNDDLPQGHDDMEAPGEQNEQQELQGNDSGDDEESEEDSNAGDTDSDQGETDKSSEDQANADTAENQSTQTLDEDQSLTDNFYRNAERDLIDLDENGRQTTYVNGPKKEVLKKVIISYEDLAKDRIKRREKAFKGEDSSADCDYEANYDRLKKLWPTRLKEIKTAIRPAVKEFEQRKAAQRWQKASVAKTGMLNVNKLHAYKTDDDIFLRATKLADSKNHGMMMYIDYSGSMHGTLSHVLDQLLHLVVFCKTVQIPFDVYGFTSSQKRAPSIDKLQIDSDIDFHNVALPNLINSNLKKSDYEEALFQLFARATVMKPNARYWDEDDNGLDWRFKCDLDCWISSYEQLGSTPLNHALVAAHTMVKDFRAKNAIEKMNLVILSDGDSNGMSTHHGDIAWDNQVDTSGYWNRGAVAIIDKKKVELSDLGRRCTKDLLSNLQKTLGCNTLGFFVSFDNHDFRSKISEVNSKEYYDGSDVYKEANTMYRKEKVAHYQNVIGYNEFYVVKGQQLGTATDEALGELQDDASKGQIGAAFRKQAKSKKANKVLLTKFGIAVA